MLSGFPVMGQAAFLDGQFFDLSPSLYDGVVLAEVDVGEAVVEVGTAAISFSSARVPTTCAPIECKRARKAASEV